MTTSGTVPARETPPLVRTLPGRLFILSSIALFALLVIRQFVALPDIVETFRKVARLAWLVSAVWLSIRLVARHSDRFLWRVRQKLILSYVFLGFVPVLLVVSLVFVGGLIMYINVAAYMFREGLADVTDDLQQIAEDTALDVGRTSASAADLIARRYQALSAQYPRLSFAVVPGVDGKAIRAVQSVKAGSWRHVEAPSELPAWLTGGSGGFRGVVAVRKEAGGDLSLILRSVVLTPDHLRAVIVDLPLDLDVVAALEARTKTRIAQTMVPDKCGGTGQASVPLGGMLGLFKQSIAFVDCRDWTTGSSDQILVGLDAPISRLYSNIETAAPQTLAGGLVLLFILLGVFFLLIQGAALFFGALLARSITYAVHELFAGTERVQQGDFTQRIPITSADQLGDLAGSFNRMSASIEHLLHVQREKQRLDDELRIAREIQKSLLPTNPPVIDGVSIADLCEPAREVGGDYYDFFDLGSNQLGVMIADVSGKGTSAALYMAELKGLMLSLSHNERSPRKLLLEANRLLSAHLDNRSFITMTYMVLDLEARTLTCARAGHTPLLVVSGGQSEVVIPAGMVLGLRLPGASERFGQILEEYTRKIEPGDVFVLYTDGISEAMDAQGELFSDEGLARVVVNHHTLDAPGIRERVVREVRAFVGEGEPHDDMTMIVVKIGEPELAA